MCYSSTKSNWIVLLCIFFFLIILPAPLFAVTKTLYPTTETYVHQSTPDENFSQRPILGLSYFGPNGQFVMTFLKFDLSSIPQNATITSAILYLYQTNASPDGNVTVIVTKALNNWDSTVTWNTKPRLSGTYASTIDGSFKNGYVTWTITDLVKEWQSGQSSNYGLGLSMIGIPGPTIYTRTYYSNRSVGLAGPSLRVEYTLPFNPVQNAGGNNPLANVSIKPIAPISNGGFNLPAMNDNTAPTISEVKVSNITYSQATITWKTNENASSWVFYGNSNNGDQFNLQTGQNDATTSHSVTLSSLEQNTRYSFKVMSKDLSNNTAYGDISHFSSAEEHPGSIADIRDNDSGAGGSDNSGNQNPLSSDQTATQEGNFIGNLKDTLENKVADYTIQNSLGNNNAANQTPGTGAAVDNLHLNSGNSILAFAENFGFSKLATLLLIILGVILLIMAVLAFILTRKVHHHIKKHLAKKTTSQEQN